MFITLVHNLHYTPQQVWETTWPEYLLILVGFQEMDNTDSGSDGDILDSEEDVLATFRT